MKANVSIAVVIALVIGVAAYAADQARGQRLGLELAPANSVGFASVWAIAGFVGTLIVIVALKFLWRGLLRGTKQVSNAVQGKEP